MAILRLFANLRELAGTSSVEIEAPSVGDVLAVAGDRFGQDFTASLQTAQVWVNGEQADVTTPVGVSDEVAVIPPVSGGETAVAQQPDIVGAMLIPALGVAVAVANVISIPLLVAVATAAAMIWLWDLSEVAALRGRTFNAIPALVAVALAANGTYRWGRPGLAGALALGMVFMLVWAVADPRQRALDRIAITAVLAAVGSVGIGALVLLRLGQLEEVLVAAFLVVAVGAGGLTFLVQRYGSALPGADPNIATLVGAIVGGLLAGLLADSLDIWNTVLAAALAAGGFIAGRALGSLIRSGQVIHTVRSPGVLTGLDGIVFASAMFWIGHLLFG